MLVNDTYWEEWPNSVSVYAVPFTLRTEFKLVLIKQTSTSRKSVVGRLLTTVIQEAPLLALGITQQFSDSGKFSSVRFQFSLFVPGSKTAGKHHDTAIRTQDTCQ